LEHLKVSLDKVKLVVDVRSALSELETLSVASLEVNIVFPYRHWNSLHVMLIRMPWLAYSASTVVA
jgi:hypothetical protein